MKKIISLSTILFALFILISYNLDDFDGESIKLETPEEIEINGKTLSWDKVDNASQYKVKVGSQVQTIDGQNFSLNDIEDGTKLSIQAIGDNGEYTNSSWSKEIIYTSLSSNSEDDSSLSDQRLIAKPFPSEEDEYVGYGVVNNRSVFYFYLGSILDTPVSYSKSIRLTNNNIEYTFEDQTTLEEDFSYSRVEAKKITKAYEVDFGIGFEYTKNTEVGIPEIGNIKTGITANFTANLGFRYENEITTSDEKAHSYGISNSKISSLKYTLSTENNIGDSNFFEHNYYYRLVEYSTMDAYGVIFIDPETNEYTWDFLYYARIDKPNSFSLEKSSNTNGFFNSTSNEELVFDLEKAFEAIKKEKEKNPIDVNSQLVSTKFSAYLWCEQSNLGKVNFEVVGVKVQYDGRYYVYGNATFSGNLGGNRFNDVDQIALKSSNRKIATGGLLHWKGSADDVNEWGDAGWNMRAGFGTNYAFYSPSAPNQDFAADENVQISITNICVELQATDIDKSVPEMISVSLHDLRNCLAHNISEKFFSKVNQQQFIFSSRIDNNIIDYTITFDNLSEAMSRLEREIEKVII